MKILKANNYFDIFQGDGWYNHTRVQRIIDKNTKQVFYRYVSGTKIHPKFLAIILADYK